MCKEFGVEDIASWLVEVTTATAAPYTAPPTLNPLNLGEVYSQPRLAAALDCARQLQRAAAQLLAEADQLLTDVPAVDDTLELFMQAADSIAIAALLREQAQPSRQEGRALSTGSVPRLRLLPITERMVRLILGVAGVRSRYVPTPSGALHMYDAPGRGQSSPIVLVHGLGTSAGTFSRMALALRPTVRRVLVPDLPDHGFSSGLSWVTVEEIYQSVSAALLRELDEPAVMYGHCLGGAFAVRFAAEHPDRVRALVMGSPVAPMAADESAELLSAFRIDSSVAFRALLARTFHRKPWFASLLAGEMRAHFARPELVKLWDALCQAEFPTAAHLRSLPMPALLLWGRSDRLLPRTTFDFYRAYLPPDTAIEEIESVGHFPHIDAPDKLVQRLLAFASRNVAASKAQAVRSIGHG